MNTVIVAMDKFKGSATAELACGSLCEGIQETSTGWRCVQVPLADGGDGTVAALCRAGWDSRSVSTIDAQGAVVHAEVALLENTSVVEMANICGLALWQGELRPWDAHTTGLGIAIRQQIQSGAQHIVLAAGGSASTDGGLGLLLGLGFRITDQLGKGVEPGLEGLRFVEHIEYPPDMDVLRAVRWTVLVDVDSPLCGPNGAARRFGPQKGLSDADTEVADGLLSTWGSLLERIGGVPVSQVLGVGAAGGVAAPLVALLNARIESGFHFIAQRIRLREALASADLIITGEGRVDPSSLTGKVPGEVISMAEEFGVETIVVAGSVEPEVRPLLAQRIVTLTELAGGEANALVDPTRYLRQAGRLIGADLG